MNITIYYGGCWATNIGNSFIDYGAMHVCQKYNPCIYSEYDYLMFKNRRQNYFNGFLDLKPKCIFFSGMVTCEQFVIDQKEIFQIIDSIGVPVVLNGVGGENYTQKEIHAFRNFIKSHKFIGFISRDDETYEAYHDLFPKSYKGIDVGFFLSEIDRFKFLNELPKKYTVFNNDSLGFNRSPEVFEEYKQSVIDHSEVRTHHQLTDLPESYISLPKTMLSEMPDQYIYMYAQSKMTFSTRVHACVATLSFGGKCALLYNTPRSCMFKTVGCGQIVNTPCSVDKNVLEAKKQCHRNALDEIMKGVM